MKIYFVLSAIFILTLTEAALFEKHVKRSSNVLLGYCTFKKGYCDWSPAYGDWKFSAKGNGIVASKKVSSILSPPLGHNNGGYCLKYTERIEGGKEHGAVIAGMRSMQYSPLTQVSSETKRVGNRVFRKYGFKVTGSGTMVNINADKGFILTEARITLGKCN